MGTGEKNPTLVTVYSKFKQKKKRGGIVIAFRLFCFQCLPILTLTTQGRVAILNLKRHNLINSPINH